MIGSVSRLNGDKSTFSRPPLFSWGCVAVFLINILTPISFSFLDLFLSWFKTAVSAAQSPAASAAIVQKTCHYMDDGNSDNRANSVQLELELGLGLAI